MFGDSEDKIMGIQIVLGTWDKKTQIRLLEMKYY